MKAFSFFSSKGGVGKTCHTELFASYLRYYYGTRVCVLNFESRLFNILNFRESELQAMKNPDSSLSRYLSKHDSVPSPYDIIDFVHSDKGKLEYTGLNKIMFDNCWKFYDEHQYDYDYVLLDFDCLFIEDSVAFSVLLSGFVDLVAIPVCVDNESRIAGFSTAETLLYNNQKPVVFWNNVSSADLVLNGYLDSGESLFRDKLGIDFLPERIKTFQKAKRDSEGKLFVRSTVCWPQRYVEMSCSELVSLYDDLKSRLDAI